LRRVCVWYFCPSFRFPLFSPQAFRSPRRLAVPPVFYFCFRRGAVLRESIERFLFLSLFSLIWVLFGVASSFFLSEFSGKSPSFSLLYWLRFEDLPFPHSSFSPHEGRIRRRGARFSAPALLFFAAPQRLMCRAQASTFPRFPWIGRLFSWTPFLFFVVSLSLWIVGGSSVLSSFPRLPLISATLIFTITPLHPKPVVHGFFFF